MRFYTSIFLIFFIFILSGCSETPPAAQEPDYDQTKKMVIDILQTDEGKKALREVMTDDKMKQQLVMDSDEVKEAITEALVSEQGTEMWKKLFDDADFATSFVSSTKEGQEELFKHLMNDAAFQKKMMEILQNPEMKKQTLTLLKSQQFREHLEKRIEETIASPLFQEKMRQELLKAGEQEHEEKENAGNDDEKSNE